MCLCALDCDLLCDDLWCVCCFCFWLSVCLCVMCVFVWFVCDLLRYCLVCVVCVCVVFVRVLCLFNVIVRSVCDLLRVAARLVCVCVDYVSVCLASKDQVCVCLFVSYCVVLHGVLLFVCFVVCVSVYVCALCL